MYKSYHYHFYYLSYCLKVAKNAEAFLSRCSELFALVKQRIILVSVLFLNLICLIRGVSYLGVQLSQKSVCLISAADSPLFQHLDCPPYYSKLGTLIQAPDENNRHKTQLPEKQNAPSRIC